MTEIRSITYDVDATTMVGQLALPDGRERCPAVLVAHEGSGLDDLQRQRAAGLADLGYVTFALDYHGGGDTILDRDQMMRRLDELWEDPEVIRRLGHAGLEILLDEPRVDPARIAAVGYCFGGAMVLELARSGADLGAVVAFHPRLSTKRPDDADNIKAKVLVCVGAADPLVPLEERNAFEAEMHRAGIDWRMYVFGNARHGFTHPWADALELPEFGYDQDADRRSWQAMLELFAELGEETR